MTSIASPFGRGVPVFRFNQFWTIGTDIDNVLGVVLAGGLRGSPDRR